MKAIVTLFTVAFVLIFGTAMISPGVAVQSNSYDDAWYSDGPTITFYAKNATSDEWIQLISDNSVIYSDTGNVTLRIQVGGPSRVSNSVIESEGGVIRWLMGYLTSVSYKAGWQYNKNVQVYTNTSNDGEKTLEFELTNIPNYGSHSLEVDASCVVYVFGGGLETVYFSDYRSYLEFTVAPNPTPSPVPTVTSAPMFSFSLEQMVTIVAVVVAVAVLAVGLVLWRKVAPKGTN